MNTKPVFSFAGNHAVAQATGPRDIFGKPTGSPITDIGEAVSDFWWEHVKLTNGFDPNLEHAAVLYLDASRRILGSMVLAGNSRGVDLEIEDIFKPPGKPWIEDFIASQTKFLVLSHNHPPELDVTPSGADVNYTLALQAAAAAHGMELLDHIVLANGFLCSFKKSNLMPLVPLAAKGPPSNEPLAWRHAVKIPPPPNVALTVKRWSR